LALPKRPLKKTPPARAIHFSGCNSRTIGGRPESSGGSAGQIAVRFRFSHHGNAADKEHKGGEVRIVDSSNFKVSTAIAMAMVTLHPGGLRELHWHPNASEWQYYIAGKGRMTVVSTGNRARTMDFQMGDVGYVEKSLLHYIENTGDTDLIFLEMFKSSFYQDLSLSEWLAHTPPELVMAHLNIDKATLDAIAKEKFGDCASLADRTAAAFTTTTVQQRSCKQR